MAEQVLCVPATSAAVDRTFFSEWFFDAIVPFNNDQVNPFALNLAQVYYLVIEMKCL